jgi:uncharacterized protein (PEP-CTERM system associated)
MAWLDMLMCAAALATSPMSLRAQTTPNPTPLLVTVDGSLRASDNGALSAPGLERRELITSIRPKVEMTRRGAGLDLDLEAAATLLAYANGTQRSGVLPDARASLKATIVDRWLYVDAAARVRQSEVDPFGSRADDTTGANRRTEGSYRLSPAIERALSPNASLLARHDATLTTNGAGGGTRLVSNRSLFRLERKPIPLGAAVELSRLENESRGVASSRFTLETARLQGSAAFAGEVVLGAVAGRDHSQLLLSDHTDSLYGLTAQWNASPRTELSANVEHRYFGRAGALTLRHRMPFMSFALAMSRQPVIASTSLGVLGQGSDIRSFLDAILTTRYPDPSVRGDLVNTLVTSRGLDTRLPTPIDIVAEYPQLQTSANATWVVLGTRNTTSVTLYAQTLRQLTRDGDPLSLSAGAAADSRQTGGSFKFNRRLTSQLSGDAIVQWSKITGLAARAGDVSEERIYRLALTQNLSLRTGVSAGVQQNRFTTTVSGQHSYDATLVSIGMSHRF